MGYKMSGWELKNGSANTCNFGNEYFWQRIGIFLSKKTTMKNLYKLAFMRSFIKIKKVLRSQIKIIPIMIKFK